MRTKGAIQRCVDGVSVGFGRDPGRLKSCSCSHITPQRWLRRLCLSLLLPLKFGSALLSVCRALGLLLKFML